jgi:hypothetical protein
VKTSTEALIKARLSEQVDEVFGDDGPAETPRTAYVVLYDTGGPATSSTYAPGAQHLDETFRVLCVARTTETLREVVARVRGQLNEWSPHARASRLVERECGPLLPSGVAGDIRQSQTLVYGYNEPRSS